MNLDSIDWDEDLPPASPEEEYQALRRAIQRTDGFGLIFVQCAPAKGHEIIEQIKGDLPQRKIEVLSLKEPIRNLYERVEALPNRNKIDVLFIEGLEYSIYEYEDVKRHLGWTTEEIQSYSWKGVPHVLTNLNQQRERFRDNLQICLVFIVPHFVLKYVIYRAPDFFDWRSGIFQFRMDIKQLQHETLNTLINVDYDKYSQLTPEELTQTILHIQTLIEENREASSNLADLYYELGNIFIARRSFQEALASHSKALEAKPSHYKAWYGRGYVLGFLNRNEEALSSYNKVLEFKPDDYRGWYGLGYTFDRLGRYEEALSSYNKALGFKPDNYIVWHRRGIALKNLGRYEEAVISYDKALEIKLDDHSCWHDKGIALSRLHRYQEALMSYDKAQKIDSNCSFGWIDRGHTLFNIGKYKEAADSYRKAIDIEPDNPIAWGAQGGALLRLKCYKKAIDSCNQAVNMCSGTDSQKNKAYYLLTLSQAYSSSGQIIKGIIIANQANQLLWSLGLPTEEMPYPNWLKRMIKFSEKGKLYTASLVLGLIVFAPIYIPVLLILFVWIIVVAVWRILRFWVFQSGETISKR